MASIAVIQTSFSLEKELASPWKHVSNSFLYFSSLEAPPFTGGAEISGNVIGSNSTKGGKR